ncbi:unnamed protein product [Polarella glacialis]|uniref:Uncharacterized protein n=1 Tax=Polarella glacialis TaxID=89957 RepID=A0A813EVW5_POLGL|nr:unnamed protein product [Polarella glacialis]
MTAPADTGTHPASPRRAGQLHKKSRCTEPFKQQQQQQQQQQQPTTTNNDTTTTKQQQNNNTPTTDNTTTTAQHQQQQQQPTTTAKQTVVGTLATPCTFHFQSLTTAVIGNIKLIGKHASQSLNFQAGRTFCMSYWEL